MIIKKAEDLYDVMYPVFIISKILGLAPFQYNHKGSKSYSVHFGVITILRFILVVGVMCYVCFVMEEVNFTVNIGGMALRYELYFGTIMTAVILLMAMMNQKLTIKAVVLMVEIDADLKRIGVAVSYKKAQIFSYAQVCFIAFMFAANAILQPFSGSVAYFVIYSIFNVVDYINTSMLFQYVNMLLLIRQRFIWINRKVRQLSDLSKTIITMHDNNYTEGVPHLIHVTPVERFDSGHLIINLGKIHSKLHAVCKITNRMYGVQLLVTIAIRFVMITTQLINTYKVIQDPRLAGSVTHSLIGIYLFLHFSKIFLVSALSDNTATKVLQHLNLFQMLNNSNIFLGERHWHLFTRSLGCRCR